MPTRQDARKTKKQLTEELEVERAVERLRTVITAMEASGHITKVIDPL